MTTDMDLITNSFDGMAYKGLSQRLHQLKGGGGVLVVCWFSAFHISLVCFCSEAQEHTLGALADSQGRVFETHCNQWLHFS